MHTLQDRLCSVGDARIWGASREVCLVCVEKTWYIIEEVWWGDFLRSDNWGSRALSSQAFGGKLFCVSGLVQENYIYMDAEEKGLGDAEAYRL